MTDKVLGYCYRITDARSPTNVLCAGSVRAANADDAIRSVLRRLDITVHDTHYDDDSMMAGAVYRTDFYMGGRPVSVSLIPGPSGYR